MTTRITIQSFDWRTLKVVQRIAPQVPTVYLSAENRFFDNILADNAAGSAWTAGVQYKEHGSVPKKVKAAGGKVWCPFFRNLTESSAKEAKDLGIGVIVWTVNDPTQITKMLDLGVDGIITDRPDLAREVMKKHGISLPPSTPVSP
jgi:glycerophosphoryl diester phosphodiesterase